MDFVPRLTAAIGKRVRGNATLLANEKLLQDAVEEALIECGLEYAREERLNAQDRPDFLLKGKTLAVEIKKGRATLGDLRQVGRYLEHDQIHGLLFIASMFATRVPVLCGKPIHYLDLWKYQL